MRIYFAHGYKSEDRRFNEHIWNLLHKKGFSAWIDTGLTQGWEGDRLPMDVSFNEWMLSRCEGFVAVGPIRRSDYQSLEYRLALRLRKPTLVLVQQGGDLGKVCDEAISFPTSWAEFWSHKEQEKLTDAIEAFSERVTLNRNALDAVSIRGTWRPKSSAGVISIALLPPSVTENRWVEAHELLRHETDLACELLNPRNLNYAHEILKKTSTLVDLLVVDVGPQGTPQEMLGYLDALGIPQIRVCSGDEPSGSALSIGSSSPPPFESVGNPPLLPRGLDGWKIDVDMEPVFFWRKPEQLAHRVKALVDRIVRFRSGPTPEKGGSRVTLQSRQSALAYFGRLRDLDSEPRVFLSFAGGGGARELASELASILRFLDFRCFHYRDRDTAPDVRLESGERVEDGLKLRVDEADIVVSLVDDAYLESSYCRAELEQAWRLKNRGEIELLPYTIGSGPTLPGDLGPLIKEAFQHLSMLHHAGSWGDFALKEKIIGDLQGNPAAIGCLVRESDRESIRGWASQDGHLSGQSVASMLNLSGVADDELASIKGAAGDWLSQILKRPENANARRRARQLAGLLLLALYEEVPDRRDRARVLIRDRGLFGVVYPPSAPDEQTEPVDPALNLASLGDEPLQIGIKLGAQLRRVLDGTGPVVLECGPTSLEAPIEWIRENEDTEPIGLRRPIRWRLRDIPTRPSVFEVLSGGGLPPKILLLGLSADDIDPMREVRALKDHLRQEYQRLCWPPELIRAEQCKSVDDASLRLEGCRDQILHIAGHTGPEGLRIGSRLYRGESLAAALAASDVRLLLLNGCEGGAPKSPLAFAYSTLLERIVRDGQVPEVVTHRRQLREVDAEAFSRRFYTKFLATFDVAGAVLEGRKVPGEEIQLSPVIVSQRPLRGK